MDVNLAYYRKKDWSKFLNMADDQSGLQDSWEEWHKDYLKTKNKLISEGLKVSVVVVNLDELKKFCSSRGFKINGKARSHFVSEK